MDLSVSNLYLIAMESTHQEAKNPFVPDEITLAALYFQDLYKEGKRSEETDAVFRQIVEGTYLLLHSTLLISLRGDDEKAQDNIQQTYERALKAFSKGQFKGDSQVSTWLYIIMTNNLKSNNKREASSLPRSTT